MLKKYFPLLLVLLLAAGVRIYRLTAVPPGLTHDEANHGREAIEILDGTLRYYFPLNYGSEPLYSYTVAGSMALLGENLLALRLVNVLFGLAAIVATYAWATRAFDRRTALLTAVLMAVSFWPLASSREALRAGLLPFFMVVAVWFFWQLLFGASPQRRRWLVVGFALSLVATFHIYLAARVAWLIFPLFLIYLALVQRDALHQRWQPVVAGLLLAGLLLMPMFIYLANNPASQTRLSMLSRPLEQIQSGAWLPIVQNSTAALLAFVWPGYGDQFLAYNIPGRPVFDGLTAVFFLLGVGISLWRWRQPPYAFLLLWFVVGIIPSLLTGPTANTTRNLAALPALYLLPPVGFLAVVDALAARARPTRRTLLVGGATLWLAVVAFVTVRDYFIRWAQSPEVRSAYQHTLVESLAYLDTIPSEPWQPVIMSSVYPGPAHDPSIALVLAGSEAQRLHWVDARYALRVPPQENVMALIPSATPPHAAFSPYLRPLETVALRPDDLDPAFTHYALNSEALPWEAAPLANFGDAVALIGAHWRQPQVTPGTTAELITAWRVLDPTRVGPLHPPADATETIIFTHVLDDNGQIVAQRDALDAPSWDWQAGDLILQVHPITVPDDAPPGTYTTIVGIYDPVTGERLVRLDAAPETAVNYAPVPPLQVALP